jgi:hypothetical protein
MWLSMHRPETKGTNMLIKPIWFLREERSDEWSAGMNGHI